jgi:hypothetical protein
MCHTTTWKAGPVPTGRVFRNASLAWFIHNKDPFCGNLSGLAVCSSSPSFFKTTSRPLVAHHTHTKKKIFAVSFIYSSVFSVLVLFEPGHVFSIKILSSSCRVSILFLDSWLAPLFVWSESFVFAFTTFERLMICTCFISFTYMLGGQPIRSHMYGLVQIVVISSLIQLTTCR